VKRAFAAFLIVFAGVAVFASRVAAQAPPSGKDVVAPTAYVSFDPVARGASFQVAVIMKIRPGFHVNAREVTEDYLIRTDLRAEVPAGFKAGEVVYPKGTLQTFSFSKDKPLNVYTDSVTLFVPVTALSEAPAGTQHIPMKLRYQACSAEICLPPVTLNLDVPLNVAASPSAARPAHPEVFSPRK
jgi:Thiol:disulfide interchange protein DsbD, N-terminal